MGASNQLVRLARSFPPHQPSAAPAANESRLPNGSTQRAVVGTENITQPIRNARPATAAEMIAGKSGLGYFTWSSYIGGNYPQIIIGMISIGFAGYFSSGLIRILGKLATPWQRRF